MSHVLFQKVTVEKLCESYQVKRALPMQTETVTEICCLASFYSEEPLPTTTEEDETEWYCLKGFLAPLSYGFH